LGVERAPPRGTLRCACGWPPQEVEEPADDEDALSAVEGSRELGKLTPGAKSESSKLPCDERVKHLEEKIAR
jgi:hypothetical protein